MSQWLSAFMSFGMSLQGSNLMQYGLRDQNLAKEATDAAVIEYDTKFRKWRQIAPLDCPWNEMNAELYHEALAAALQ